MKNKILIFELQGQTARFRVLRTIQTHNIIPRSTVAGIGAGILGYPSYMYL